MRLLLLGFLGALSWIALAANPNPFNVPEGFSLTAGKPTTLKWTPTTPGTVTLRLREGPSNNLNEGTVIQAKIPNSGSYTYTPPASTVRNSDYTIEIISDSDSQQTNYSPYFVIDSANTVASASAPSASDTPSSSTTSASASASASQSTGSSSASGTTLSTQTSKAPNSTTATSTGTSTSKSSSTATKTSTSAAAVGTSAPASAPASGAMRLTMSTVPVEVLVLLLAAAAAW